MAKAKPSLKTAGISDEAVKKATGKTWAEWCAILDKAGAKKMGHPAIARYLSEQQGVGNWWSQMVTVGYEQARGQRKKHQTASGYSVSGSKTLTVPVSRIYQAWTDAAQRSEWLPDPDIDIRKATRNKSLRVTWVDGKSNVDVNFYPKPGGKSQVAVEHSKLTTAAQGKRMKSYWRKALDRLKAHLAK